MIVLLIRLHSSPVADECGIVAQISQPLADSDISAYYISTFSFDHALVSQSLNLVSFIYSTSLYETGL